MTNRKLWSTLAAVFVLTLSILGMLFLGTSAAEDVIEYKVNGVQYSSVKAALTAAEKEEWAAGTSLVIAVDPSAVASESITHDAGGQAYAGGIAFGQKTIFRADGTRLPITIKGGSDRAAFTLNITAGTKIACANSYTFQNLTLPLGNATTATHFYAGSGQVRLENVATGTGVDASIGADTFTARVFEGWGEAEIAANADRGKIKTSMTLGKSVKYVHEAYASRTTAVLDSGGWDAFTGVSITPLDTRAEFVIDGAEVGYFRGRLGTNSVAESIQRMESGSTTYLISCGAFSNATTYTNRVQYEGDVTVIVNGGEMKSSSRLLHTAGVNGDVTVQINGGTFASYIQTGYAENSISGDYKLEITGGLMKGDLYLHPSANVSGESNIKISGGTVKGIVYGTNGVAYTNDTDSKDHNPISITITPNAKSAALDPVFEGDFYATHASAATALDVEISGGTFKKMFCTANARANGATNNTVSGGTFQGDFYGGAYKGTHKSVTNTVSGGTFNGFFFGGSKVATKGDITNHVSGGEFAKIFFGAGVTASVDGNVTNNISGGLFHHPVFGGTCTATITGTVKNNLSGPAVFEEGFCAVHGTQNTTGVTGAIVNRIFADKNGKAPEFQPPAVAGVKFTFDGVSYSTIDCIGYAFLGGTAVGTVNGSIHNTVEAGSFGNPKYGGYYQGGSRNKSGVGTIGKDENGVSVYNIIKGGTFGSIFGGGMTYGGGAAGEVYTEISGGTFKERMTAGNRNLVKVNTPITMKITGGEFFGTVNATYFALTEAQGGFAQVDTQVTLNIEGGVFHDDIYGLGNFGQAVPEKGAPGSFVKAGGSVRINLSGGVIYGDVFATNENPIVEKQVGEALITICPNESGVSVFGEIAPRFAAEQIAINGNGNKIFMNGDGAVVAASATGEIHLEQIAKWMDDTYLTLPAGNTATVEVSTKKGATGYFDTALGENGEVIRVNGAPLKAGISMIIADRLSLKVQLSKTHVDALENFAYSFKLSDGTVLAEGTASDLVHVIDPVTEFEYYTVTLSSLGIDQFEDEISVDITEFWEDGTFTVEELAESAVVAWDGNDLLVKLAKSIVNLSKAVSHKELPYELSPEKVDYDRVPPTKSDSALVQFTGKHLLMDSAVGIRIKGTVAKASDAEDLTICVNGYDVTDRVLVKVDGTAVNVDIFFSIYGVTKEFKLEILDRNGANCLTMYERLDALAEQYGTSHVPAQALLTFMQAVAPLEKSTPAVDKATSSDIASLDALYQGENVYYGDIHSHPDGGHISDGNVHLTEWNAMREELGVDFYAAMNHRQVSHLYDEGWDDTVFIAGSEPATVIDGIMDIHYNMFFPDAETFLEILALFPEFKYTGFAEGADITMGEFGYPKFTRARFNELITAIKARGGMVMAVHPLQNDMITDNPMDFYFQDYMGLEVFYSWEGDVHGKDTKDNYNLWCELLAMGKRLWATAGSDSHDLPTTSGLTTLYSSAQQDTAYLEKITTGDFVCGFAGIKMAIGETKMGGHTDFAGKKLVFSVGDVFHTYLAETRMYRVNVITDQGVVATTVIDGSKTTYFAMDADENAKFYRIEVLDEEIENQPIIAIGNPIWND